MPLLCQYKNIFGAPNTGVHKYRVFGFAIVDVIATLVIAALMAKFIPHIQGWNFWEMFAFYSGLLILISIFIHMVFCVDTTLVKMLGLN